jgi:hypothetical protein
MTLNPIQLLTLPRNADEVFILRVLSNFGKTWASRRNICNASAIISGIKREWYVYTYLNPRKHFCQ